MGFNGRTTLRAGSRLAQYATIDWNCLKGAIASVRNGPTRSSLGLKRCFTKN